MPIQLASTDELQVVLDAAPTNQLPINASYVDQGGSGGNLPSVTAGVTPVMFVASPSSGVERLVNQISIPNVDTATRIITVNLVRSGIAYEILSYSVASGYHLFYDGEWRVNDNKGNFLCNVTVTGGTLTANQGTAAAINAPWPVELSNGTAAVGTAGVPLRIDPVGTTSQPVSGTFWQTTQPVSLASLPALVAGSATIGAVTQASGPWIFNLTEVGGATLGAGTAWGTPPSGNVIGVNANILNASLAVTGTFWQTTQPVSIASTVNVDVTNTLTVNTHAVTQSGTWAVGLSAGSAAIGTVGVTSLPALPAGSNTIGAVTQGSGPWTFNLTQVGSTALGVPTSWGTAPSGNVLGVNANILNTYVTTIPAPMSLASGHELTTTTPTTFALSVGFTKLRLVKIDLAGYTLSALNTLTLLDGAGNNLGIFVIPAGLTTTTAFNMFFSDNLNEAMVNTSTGVSATLGSAPSAGGVVVQIGYSN